MERNLKSHPYSGWGLIKAYWQSEHRYFAYLLLGAVVVMTMAIVGMEVVFNYWYQYFYDALQDYNKKAVIDWMWIFLFLAAVWIVIQVYRYYLQSILGLRWRRWLTDQFLNRWLEKRSYYYLENFDEKTDNPDQRIQEDINAIVSYSIDLTIGLFSSVATIFAFIFILWKLSGSLVIPLGPLGHLTIPGYLVWVSLVYAALGTFFTVKIGTPLVNLNFEQQRKEADFRFAAVNLRTHAEDVALYRGEKHQKTILGRLFERVLDNWYMIILRQKLLLWFTAGYNQVAVFVPLVVALPNYFGKVFRLGGFMQALRAFQQIQDAFSFVVSSYVKIAEWRAVKKRLLTFLNHIYDVENNAMISDHFIVTKTSENKITAKNLTIYTPLGEKLLENVNAEFVHGKNYLIKGVSGVGKSTFIRVLAGIWPYGSGEVGMPADKKIMYVPQKPYMPLGTLRQALLFPDHFSQHSDETLKKMLEEIGLPDLAGRLNDVAMWSQQFSPGEQQRVAFIRILIQQPDWVFLDESTSALDLAREKYLYQLLKTKLPNCSLVSVGHRPSLDSYHDEILDLSKFSLMLLGQEGVVT